MSELDPLPAEDQECLSEQACRAGSNSRKETGRFALGTRLVGSLRFSSQADSELGERVEIGGAIRSVRVRDEILVLHRRRSYARPDERVQQETPPKRGLFREANEGTRTLDLLPTTGKSVDVQLIEITRFDDDGLAHEHWVFDALAVLQQLGAIPQRPPG